MTEESLTCGIAMPRPIAVLMSSSRFSISEASSWRFFTWGAFARLSARASRESRLDPWFRKRMRSGEMMFWTWMEANWGVMRFIDRRSFTHFSISAFLKRHTVPILPDGISPFCAQSYTVRSETLRYFATSSMVRISSSMYGLLELISVFDGTILQ